MEDVFLNKMFRQKEIAFMILMAKYYLGLYWHIISLIV